MTVVIAGRRIDASRPARLEGDVVVGPLDPFVRDLAESIDAEGGRRFVLRRGDRTIAFEIGNAAARVDAGGRLLPVAPTLDGDEPYVPLAAVARALGATVGYDRDSRTLSIVVVPTPVVTMTPFARYLPPPGPLPTFTAKPIPAPAATVTGVPRPRRTPILVSPDRSHDPAE